MHAAMLIPLAAGLVSAAVSHGVRTFTPENSPSYWVVSNFTTSPADSFGLSFNGVYGKTATCRGTATANVWTPCDGTLNSAFKLGEGLGEIFISTNLTQNNAAGLLYSIDDGSATIPSDTTTSFNVPLSSAEDFYAS